MFSPEHVYSASDGLLSLLKSQKLLLPPHSNHTQKTVGKTFQLFQTTSSLLSNNQEGSFRNPWRETTDSVRLKPEGMAPASACKTWNQDADFLNPSPVLFSLGQDFLDALTFDEWLSDNLLIKHPLDMECAHWPNPFEK